MADGGGICISGSAYEQIENKLALGYNFIGEHSVKNIAKPIRVYKVPMDPKDVVKKTKPKLAKNAAIAVALVMIFVVGAVVWKNYSRTDPALTEVSSKKGPNPKSIEKEYQPLSDKPSIAVLPFANLSKDPGQDYFADGITEDIINGLSKTPKLFVIARNSTFTYKGKPIKVQEVRKDLGVRYVLEGSIQKSEDRVRITAQLIDAKTGNHIWSDRYDRELKDLFALQDEITMKVIEGLRVNLTEGEQGRIYSRGTKNIEAYLKVLKGLDLVLRFRSKEDNALGRQMFEEAIVLDPSYVNAYVMLAWTHLHDKSMSWTETPKKSLEKGLKIAQKAVSLDESNPSAWSVLEGAYRVMGIPDKALAAGKRAIALAPNGADANAIHCYTLLLLDKNEDALTAIKKAIHLNPISPLWYLAAQGQAYQNLGQYEEAIETYKKLLLLNPNYVPVHTRLGEVYRMVGQDEKAIEAFKKAIQLNPNYLNAHIGLAATYSLTGQEERARVEAKKVLRINPKFSLLQFSNTFPLKNKADKDRIMDALRKAGLPENPPEKASLPVPDKPSIAVLPFDNISGDPKEQYLCDGFTEQIITVLAKIPDLSVTARNTTFTYKGTPVNVQQLGKDLNVKYVLEGSIQKSSNQIRVTAQLIDTATGNHLWAETYDRNIQNIFVLQDEIALKILKSLHIKLVAGPGMNPCARGTENVGAYLKFLQALHFLNLGTIEDLYLSRQMCQEAVKLDPDYGPGYGLLAETYLFEITLCVSKSPKQSVGKAFEMAQKALNVNNSCPYSRAVMGLVYMFMGQYDKSMEEMKAVIDEDPNWPHGYVYLSGCLRDWNKAIELIDRAFRLNPLPPSWYFAYLGRAYSRIGKYEEAISAYKNGLETTPNNLWCHLGLAVCYAIMGREEDTKSEVSQILELNPHYSLACMEPILKSFKDEAIRKRLTESLVKAGLE